MQRLQPRPKHIFERFPLDGLSGQQLVLGFLKGQHFPVTPCQAKAILTNGSEFRNQPNDVSITKVLAR